MKKFVLILLLLTVVLCCVSCSANTKAGELKTHIIYGNLSSYYTSDLEEELNTWLTENSQVQIVDIQYVSHSNSGSFLGSVLIIYQE